MTDTQRLLNSSRRAQAILLRGAARFLLSNVHRSVIRNTGHYREWYRCPMNYARIMETPLTLLFLGADRAERILDISSPKLLSLCYARWGFRSLVAADRDAYFVADFEAYKEHCGLQIATELFDATEPLPFPDDHFHKAFSVSALEHIPHDGDRRAVAQTMRVLAEGGRLVITLPAFPEYVEEWVSPDRIYWHSIANAEGKVFYQRRYDRDALYDRLSVDGAQIEEVVLVAEKPIAEPRIGDDGLMLHNSYYIDQVPIARFLRTLGRRVKRLPLLDYTAQNLVSRRCHYLTTDWSDPNIRQVVVSMRKSGSPTR